MTEGVSLLGELLYLVLVYAQIKAFSSIMQFSNAGVKAVFLSLILIVFDLKLFYSEVLLRGICVWVTSVRPVVIILTTKSSKVSA